MGKRKPAVREVRAAAPSVMGDEKEAHLFRDCARKECPVIVLVVLALQDERR